MKKFLFALLLLAITSSIASAQCGPDCAVCEGTKCVTCNPGFAFIPVEKKCIRCSSIYGLDGCGSCTVPGYDYSGINCTSCLTGFYFGTCCYGWSGKLCDPRCDKNQTKNYNGCGSCGTGCETCNPPAENQTTPFCTKCSDGWTILNGTCYAPCNSNCSVCGGATGTICTECKTGWALYHNGICIGCDEWWRSSLLIGCNTCAFDLSKDWAPKCNSCKTKFYLNGNYCVSCSSECSTCTNSSFCTSCSDSQGYVMIDGLCWHKCNQNCSQCGQFSNGSTGCIACKEGFKMEDSGLCFPKKSSWLLVLIVIIAIIAILCLLCGWCFKYIRKLPLYKKSSTAPNDYRTKTQWIPCSHCNGKGYFGPHNVLAYQCMECGGTKGRTVEKTVKAFESSWIDCDYCLGAGVTAQNSYCSRCHGYGGKYHQNKIKEEEL